MSHIHFLLTVVIVVASSSVAFAQPTTVWRTKVQPAHSFGDPVVDYGLMFQAATNVGKRNSTLYALDKDTGALLWSVTNDGVGMYVATGEGMVFHSTMTHLYAFNVMNGSVVWSMNAANLVSTKAVGRWPGKPTYDATTGLVYCTWYNTPAVAIRAADGKPMGMTSHFVTGRIWANYSTFVAMSIASGSGNWSLMSFNATTTDKIWESASFGQSFTVCAASLYGITVKAAVGNATALQGFDRKTGAMLFSNVAPQAVWDFNVGLNNVYQAYLTATDYVFQAVDMTTGATRWAVRVNTTDPSINVVAFPHSNVVMMQGQQTGHVWAFDAFEGFPLWDLSISQPKYGYMDAVKYYFGANTDDIMAVLLR